MLSVCVSCFPCVLREPNVCLQKERRTVMETMTGILVTIMTAIQMRKKLLRTVFALKVSIVGERGFRSFTFHREVETFNS